MNRAYLSLMALTLTMGCTGTQKHPHLSPREPATIQALSSLEFVTFDQLNPQLKELNSSFAALLPLLKPRNFSASRLHTSKGNEVRSAVQSVNTKLESLLDQIEANLQLHRAGQGPDNISEWESQRKLITEFNKLILNLKETKLVYDRENLLGAYGGAENLIPQKFPTVSLTSMDYTTGFAVECQTSWKSGLVVHRNPKTGEVTWNTNWKSIIAIGGENPDGTPILEDDRKTGLTSAFDPQTKKWLIFHGDWKAPIAAAYNEATGTIETRVSDKKTGIGGVYNPETKQVEWMSEFKSGVAGYFDPQLKKVIWKIERKSGVACLWRDDAGVFHSTSGFASDFGDDDIE